MQWRPLHGWVLAWLAVLLSRAILVAFPPEGQLYFPDELVMTLSAVDRFLGVPSLTLAWPGTTLQLLTTPAVGLQLARGCLHAGHDARNLSCLATGLGEIYLHPWGVLATMRLASALLASATPLLLVALSRRAGAGRGPALLGGLYLATNRLLWQEGAMATGEAASVTFALAAFLWAMPSDKSPPRPFISGLLVGLAVASKVTVLMLAGASVFILLLAPGQSKRARLRASFRWGAGVVVAFASCCPYVWTDPLRLLKATLGNFMRPGTSRGAGDALAALNEAAGGVGWIVAGGALLAIAVLVARPATRWLGAASAAGLMVIAAPLVTAGLLSPRYTVPALTFACLLTTLSLTWILGLLPERGARVVLTVAFLIPVWACLRTLKAEHALRSPDAVLAATDGLLTELTQGDVYLPGDVVWQTYPAVSREDIAAMRASAERGLADEASALNFLQAHGVDRTAGAALIDNFNGLERVMLARLRVMELVAPSRPRRLHFYVNASSQGDVDEPRIPFFEGLREEAIRSWQASSGPAGILVNRELPGLTAAGGDGGWLRYEKGAAAAAAVPK